MNQKKSKPIAVRRLMLAVTLLLLCAVVTVEVTWARYQEEENSYLKYNTREPGMILLWSDYDPLTGELTEGNRAWRFSNGTGELDIYVSNGTSTVEYSEEDQSVSIRLIGTLGISNAQVSILVSENGIATRCTATPVPIQEGTPLYSTFGSGNTYIFRDEDGKELSWNLEGGTLSVLGVLIDVQNLEKVEDAALLQLQVLGK